MLISKVPAILVRLPRMDALPSADELDARIDDILNAEWLADDERDALIDDGMRWYTEHAPNAILELAIHHELDVRTIAGMLASMSAGYSWPMSLDHVSTLIEGSREGIAMPYGKRAIEQAEMIRDGADPDLVLRSADGRTHSVKRWNFFHALMGDSSMATVDVHMARGLTGGVIEGTPSTANRYNLLADAIRRAADRHDMTPADMQAVLWTLIRGEAH